MRGKRKFWQFRAAADDPKVGELLLYGEISDFTWWGDEVTPRQFREDLEALGDIDELRVYINSPGGDVFAGQAILSTLKRHKARKVVYIDGLAASAASVVAMAGDVIRMPRNAMMMIHNVWTIAIGDANELREVADALDRITESVVAAYQEKTGLDADEIRRMMDIETWMTAEEAVEKGFADEVEETRAVAASLRNGNLIVNGQEVSLTRFKNPPKLLVVPGNDEPPQPEPRSERGDPDAERERRLKLLALELELLTGSSF